MMNIQDIDSVSFATRVGYTAAAELFNLLQEEDVAPEVQSQKFLPLDAPEALEERAVKMGEYICLKGCETGERLFRWMNGEKLYGQSWQELDQTHVLTFETFVQVCSSTYTKLRCRQIEAEQAEQRPPAPEPLAIEDTIFEPVGSLGEMLPHAIEASAWMATHQAEAADDETGAPNEMSLGQTVHSTGTEKVPGRPAEASGLSPAPKTPVQRKSRSAARDNAK